jgi:hypothetical protein
MTEPSAVQQAVDLLTGRLEEARQRRDQLTAEITTIENALTSLSVYSAGVTDSQQANGLNAPAPGARAAGTTSVRAAVRAILDSEDRAFAPAEIRALIPNAVMNGKSAQQRTNSVRTALWTLRQKGEAALVDESRTKSTKWATSNPELPAENGAGPLAFEEAHT